MNNPQKQEQSVKWPLLKEEIWDRAVERNNAVVQTPHKIFPSDHMDTLKVSSVVTSGGDIAGIRWSARGWYLKVQFTV